MGDNIKDTYIFRNIACQSLRYEVMAGSEEAAHTMLERALDSFEAQGLFTPRGRWILGGVVLGG